jgi:hypothetical protein
LIGYVVLTEMGQQEEPLPANPGEHFQNHALKYGRTPACTTEDQEEEEGKTAGKSGIRRSPRGVGCVNGKAKILRHGPDQKRAVTVQGLVD